MADDHGLHGAYFAEGTARNSAGSECSSIFCSIGLLAIIERTYCYERKDNV